MPSSSFSSIFIYFPMFYILLFCFHQHIFFVLPVPKLTVVQVFLFLLLLHPPFTSAPRLPYFIACTPLSLLGFSGLCWHCPVGFWDFIFLFNKTGTSSSSPHIPEPVLALFDSVTLYLVILLVPVQPWSSLLPSTHRAVSPFCLYFPLLLPTPLCTFTFKLRPSSTKRRSSIPFAHLSPHFHSFCFELKLSSSSADDFFFFLDISFGIPSSGPR